MCVCQYVPNMDILFFSEASMLHLPQTKRNVLVSWAQWWEKSEKLEEILRQMEMDLFLKRFYCKAIASFFYIRKIIIECCSECELFESTKSCHFLFDRINMLLIIVCWCWLCCGRESTEICTCRCCLFVFNLLSRDSVSFLSQHHQLYKFTFGCTAYALQSKHTNAVIKPNMKNPFSKIFNAIHRI